MTQSFSRRFRSLSVLLCLAIAATLGAFGPADSAHAQGGDFSVTLSSAVIPTASSGDLTISVEPGTATPAAVNGAVSYDTAVMTVTSCTALVGVADCNIETPGQVAFAAIESAGWSEPTELISLTVTNNAVTGEAPLTVMLDRTVDVGIVDVVADTVDGAIGAFGHGDVNCDQAVDIVDALIIANFAVGNRTSVADCAFLDSATQLLGANADVNCDGAGNVVDALVIAQYAVGNRDGSTVCDLTSPGTEIYLGF